MNGRSACPFDLPSYHQLQRPISIMLFLIFPLLFSACTNHTGDRSAVGRSASEGSIVALGLDTEAQIVQKMNCFTCHKIPGISIAKTGQSGPLLVMKSSAGRRITSPEYKAAVKAGTAYATTPRQYVIESIMDPGAFIVPGFADDMPKDFSHKFTISGFGKLVDYLMQQDEAAAIEEGLDRLPNEREGSLR